MGAFVLAVGALLLVAGLYSMVTGSGEILSERGWSAYIAGSVLLSGGVVTMALGLAVRSLAGLRLAIAAGAHASPAALPQTTSEPFVAAADLDAASIAPARSPASTVQAAAALPTLTETLAPSTVPPMPDPLPAVEAYERRQDSENATSSTSPAMPAPSQDDRSSQHVEPVHEEPEVAVAAPEAAAPHEDWLERSFADLEREMAGGAPPTARAEPVPRTRQEPDAGVHLAAVASEAPPLAHVEPHDAEPAYNAVEPLPSAAVAAVADEPRHIEPFHAAAVAEQDAGGDTHAEQATVSAREADPVPQHESPVIGRYESEGTSYVMYADGSIDALSEAGVYRFASMAELKAFIES